jgi:hypothetical protein
MFRKLYLIVLISCFTVVFVRSQSVIKTEDLFKRTDNNPKAGSLNIIQDPALDTLINRYILGYKNLETTNGYHGMIGVRIQIYSSSARNAREESAKVQAEFITKFPDIKSYVIFENPGYFKIRVGDFRSNTEALGTFLLISKAFPDSYIIPNCFINFPEQNTK